MTRPEDDVNVTVGMISVLGVGGMFNSCKFGTKRGSERGLLFISSILCRILHYHLQIVVSVSSYITPHIRILVFLALKM